MKLGLAILFSLFSLCMFSQIVNESARGSYEYQKRIYQKESKDYTALKTSFLDTSFQKSPLRLLINQKSQILFTPLLEVSSGFQNKDEKNVLGFGLGADVKFNRKKWNAGFTYLRQNAQYMSYQDNYIQQNNVLPGTNVASGKNYITSDYLSAFVNYRANKIFDFELGYGRNFIGDGYRSLLLSDAANASPYLKITTKFWKLQYSSILAGHQNIYNVEGENSLYQKKYTATHYLAWKASKSLTIGLFETIVWQAKEGNYTRGFDPNYANPVIFYRPVEFSVGSSDNALVGLNVKITPFKNHVFYSQLIFDEFLLEQIKADFNQFRKPDEDIRSGWWANKYGVQLGWTAFDFFKVAGLQVRLEFNLVRPYTYAHSSSTQAYSNYNISLAHPLGANFHELVSRLEYTKDRWRVKLQYNQSRKGFSGFGENLGENIQVS
ncbi:MAG: hypothetical protein JKY48_06690, partial [Flavobacteriales bacterium]|nr:hypothetical protein [Flavobacteriales bacterium]